MILVSFKSNTWLISPKICCFVNKKPILIQRRGSAKFSSTVLGFHEGLQSVCQFRTGVKLLNWIHGNSSRLRLIQGKSHTSLGGIKIISWWLKRTQNVVWWSKLVVKLRNSSFDGGCLNLNSHVWSLLGTRKLRRMINKINFTIRNQSLSQSNSLLARNFLSVHLEYSIMSQENFRKQ